MSPSTKTASARVRTPASGRSVTCDASSRLAAGTTSRPTCSLLADSATDSIPRVGWMSPSNETSPTAAVPLTASTGMCPQAAKTANATGRSKPEPSLGTSTGLRLMVIRLVGSGRPLLAVPERMRSLASRTAAPGSPTTVIPGRPGLACASTLTGTASNPTSANPQTAAIPTVRSRYLGEMRFHYRETYLRDQAPPPTTSVRCSRSFGLPA